MTRRSRSLMRNIATSLNDNKEPISNKALERPSMRCLICGLTAFARDPEMVKYGKSHYDCECGGHSFYPRAMQRAQH